LMPRSFTSSALASAIRYRVSLTVPEIASAILCMVLVHNTTKSALFDPTCRLCEGCGRLFPPTLMLERLIPAKSMLYITVSAE
jgi:hypothetical protein